MAFSTMGTAGGALGGAAAGSAIMPGIGTAVGGLLGGLAGSGLFGGSKTGSGLPQFNPQQALALEQQQYQQMSPQALQFGQNAYNQAAQEGLQFSKQGTQANIANQNLVTPGSSAQRQLAQNQINSYIQGQIPLDVQQQINRQVAQNLGGGFNLFSGGGQAPQNFARNIGQTSLGLSQYGLSAAPTWQQLANQMVVSPAVGLSAGLQATGMGTQLAASAAGLGNQLAESQYQGAFNQYQANQLQNQQQAQLGLQLGQMGLQGYDALNKAKYYGSLTSPAQGTSAYSNQFGSDMQSGTGFYETPAAVQAAFGRGAIPAYYSGGGQSGYYNQGFTG
jgi:hypothetical protein